MAIHLEAARNDDKIQWQVVPTIYSSIVESSTSASASSPLDFTYSNEFSDQDDRRTSSCSPESCDLFSSEGPPLGNSVTSISDRSLQPPVTNSHKMTGFIKKAGSPSLEWSTQRNINRNPLINKFPLINCSKRARVMSNGFGESDWNENKILRKSDLLFRRETSVNEALLPSNWLNDKKPESVSLSSQRKYENKQNGVHDLTRCSDVIRKNNDNLFSPPNKFVDTAFTKSKHCKVSAISALDIVNANSVQKKVDQSKNKSDGFGETDAAEALLGLSEGFYQVTNLSKKEFSPSFDNTEQTKKAKFGINSICKQDSCENTKCNYQTATESNHAESSTKQSPFHYKKLICKKFVNSMSVPNKEKISTIDVVSSVFGTCHSSENLKQCERMRCDTGSINDKSKSFITSENINVTIRNDKSLPCNNKSFQTNEQTQSLQPLKSPDIREDGYKTSSQRPCTTNDDSKKYQNRRASAFKQFSMPSGQENLSSVKRQNNEDLDTDNKKKLTSNLYRISTSLGSSTESLNAVSESINDELSSDLDSSDSSESDTDGYDDKYGDADASFTEETAKLKSNSADPSKRKVILKKAKFCIPADNQAKHAVAEVENELKKRSTKLLKRLKSVNTLPFDMVTPISSNKGNLKIKTNPTAATNINATFEPIKLSEIHIKKATFTFNSDRKNDTTTQLSGLNVTSQASQVKRTLCDENNKNSIRLVSDKLDLTEAKILQQPMCRNSIQATERETFGKFRTEVSFETLSKPTASVAIPNVTLASTRKHQKTVEPFSISDNMANVPYDKHRLPRPSARSAALEAQNQLKSKARRKRKLSTMRCKSKEKLKLSRKSSIKRPKHATDSNQTAKPRQAKKVTQPLNAKIIHSKTGYIKQNGGAVVETKNTSVNSSLERSSSRRKPSRVFKHQKYTTVSMMSSIQSPRDSISSSEFAIISKPLNLDHRVLLANSIDLSRRSLDNSSVDSIATYAMTSSSPSSRTLVLPDKDSSNLNDKKNDDALEKTKEQCKRQQQRHMSVVETNLKSEIFRRKNKLKRVLSISDRNPLSYNCRRDTSRRTERSPFHLLSLFPAPASLKAGFAQGELLPGYGPTVSGQRSSLPLRWSKGIDVRDLKQKRQREKWRNMTLDMFCMGATS